MAENRRYSLVLGVEGGLDEEMQMTKDDSGCQSEEDDMHEEGRFQSDKKEADPDLKDSDADFEDLEQEGGGGNALGDGLERLWTGLGGLLSRYSRWMVNLYLLLKDSIARHSLHNHQQGGEGAHLAVGSGWLQLLLCCCHLVGNLQQ